MFCPNCGKQNSDNTKFCTNCGFRLNDLRQESVNSHDNYVNNVSHNTSENANSSHNNQINIVNKNTGKPVNSALVNNLSNISYSDISKINVNANSNPLDPKKPKKIALGIGIPAAFIIVICALIAIFFPKIQMAVMGESTFYIYKETQNISSLFSADELSDLRHPDSYSARSIVKADCLDDDELSELISSMQVIASVDYDKSKATVVSSASLNNSDNTVLTLNGNYTDSKFIVGSDVLDSQLVFNNPFLIDISDNSAGSEVSHSIENYASDLTYEEIKIIQSLSETDKEELVKTVRKVFCDYVDEKAETKRDKIDGKSASVVTFTFEGDDLDFILAQLMREFLNNEKLAPTLEKVIGFYNYYEDEDVSIKSDEDIAEFVKDYFSFSYFIDELTLTYAYDSRGNILYRGYVVDYGEYTSEGDIYTTFKNFEVATIEAEILPDSDFNDETINISFSKEVNNNSLNIMLDYTYCYYDFYMNISNLRSEKCGGVPVLLGKMQIELSESGERYFELNAKAVTSGSEYDISANLDYEYGGKYEGTISTTLSTASDVSDIEIPSKYETDVVEYFENLFNNIGSTVSEYIEENYIYY